MGSLMGIVCIAHLRGFRLRDEEIGPMGVCDSAPVHVGGVSSSVIKSRNVFICVRNRIGRESDGNRYERKALVRCLSDSDILSYL